MEALESLEIPTSFFWTRQRSVLSGQSSQS